MRNVLILTSRKDFQSALIKSETLPYGISVQPTEVESWRSEKTEHLVELKVNLRFISETAFALWILRRLRSITGEHKIEIGGYQYPLHMPEAIDLIADAIAHGKSPKERLAA